MIGWYPPILTYHRIHPDSATDTPTMTPEVFERQMALLAARWRPISLAALATWLEGTAPPPSRAVVVTFDDGTEDTAQHAAPILARYRIPAAVFMITANIGRPGFLTWDHLRQLQAGGVVIGSHTVHHAYLPSLPIARARDELRDSRRQLAQGLGRPVEFLSYPGGGFSKEIATAAREQGYRVCCTTNRGFRRWPVDRWALRRITMHRSAASPWLLRVRCSGYAQLMKRLRAPA